MRTSSLLLAALAVSCAAPAPAPVAAPKSPLHTLAELPSASPAPSAAPAPAAATPVTPLPPKLADWIDDYVSAFGKAWGESYAMSGYVLVAQDGKPVFSKAYGKANRATGAPADADTRFRIGSITKQFTAVAILQQADKGALRLDDPLRKYLPDFAPGVAGVEKITLHNLLSHTSGIASYTDDEALMKTRDKPHAPAEVLASFAAKALAFPPGSEFRYSNSNYFLLGLVLEKVTGQSYDAYLREHVLGPAGMTRTSAVDAPDAPNSAVGYGLKDETLEPSKPIDMSLPFAAGAIRSTASDMIRWDRALAGDALLSADSRRRMVTPVKETYAYGVGVDKLHGHEVHEHSGGIDGFLSDFARVPDQKLAIVALSNNEGFEPGAIVSAILKMALTGEKVEPRAERKPYPIDRAATARFVGEYALDAKSIQALAGKVPDEVVASFRTITLSKEGAGLAFKPVGQEKLPVFLDVDGGLFTKRDGIVLVPVEPKGTAKHLTLKQGDFAVTYERR